MDRNIDLPPKRLDEDFLLPGPLTAEGERILSEIERGAIEGGLPVEADDVRLLGCAVQTIADFGQLLNVAAAGDIGVLDALRRRLEEPPGAQLWRDFAVFTGRRPIGPIHDGPCGVGPIDLGTLVWTGFHLGGGVRDPTWVNRAFEEYGALAGPVERVLDGGRVWIDSGRPDLLREGFAGLRDIGAVGQRPFGFPCLDEQQVCIGEILNFAWERLDRPTAFPPMGSLTPADVCVGYGGAITALPVGSFPLQADARGIFPTIDRRPADVLSWTPASIRLQMPPGIVPGCHSVGWGYLMDPDGVLQLRAIGEQCLPWFPTNSFKNFPLLLWRDDLSFSVIGEPATSFDANGAATLAAEACTRVNLNWAVTLAACPATKATRQVSMLRDGQPFRSTLAPSGQLPVADAEDATYTLRAAARIGAQPCATAERSVTITRQKRLRVAPLGDRCVDTQATVSLDVTVSCPAPAGGLPVTVTSSQPGRIANASASIDEGSDAATVDLHAGAQCGAVTLTVSAPDHTPAQVSLVVVGTPQIASIMPASAPTCADIAVTLTGSCLGDPALPPQAVLIGPTGDLPASVAIHTPQTELGLSHPPLPPGSYTVSLSNCGRTSFAPTPLTVSHRAPLITSPLAANATAILLCSTPTLTLSWQVRFTQTVRLMRGALVVAERTYDPCQQVSDSATDTLPAVTAGVSYTLTAINPDGVSVTSALTIPPASPAPPASMFAIQNSFSEAVNAFLINAENQGGMFLGTFQPGQGATVSIPNCRIRGIASLNPRLVGVHNTNFPNNKFDPAAVVTVRTASATWLRNFSGFRLGQASSGTQGVSI